MKNNKLNIKTGLSLADYQKKHRNFCHKLLNFSEEEIKAFDKKYGYNDQFLLKGKNWAKINDRYYEMPKAAGFNWFRNLNVAGKSAVSLLACGVVGAAVATPLSLLNNSKIVISGGKGLTDIKTHFDDTGALIVTVVPEKETDGINKDSVTVSFIDNETKEKTPIDESDFDIKEDRRVEVQKEVLDEHPNEKVDVEVNATTVDNLPEGAVQVVEKAEGGTEVVATIGEESKGTANEEVYVPSQKDGKVIDKVVVSKDDEKAAETTEKIVLSDDIKEVEHEEVPEAKEQPGAFQDFDALESARVPDNMEEYGNKMFADDDNLKEVKGGKNTETLGAEALQDTPKLEEFKGKNIKEMGEGALEITDEKKEELEKKEKEEDRKPRLKKVEVSDDLKEYPKNAMRNQENLEESKGGKHAKKAGEYSHENCKNLRRDDAAENGELVTAERGAYKNCNLKEIRVGEKSEDFEYDSFANNGNVENFYLDSEGAVNTPSYYHDLHGGMKHADNIYVREDIEVDEKTSFLSDRHKKSDDKDQDKKGYVKYEKNRDDDHKHQVFEKYDEEGNPDNLSYKFVGEKKDENKTVKIPNYDPYTKEEPQAVERIESYGMKDGRDFVENVVVPNTIKQIGSDINNGHTYEDNKKLKHHYHDHENSEIVMIASDSYKGSGLRDFYMPPKVEADNIGRDAFADIKPNNEDEDVKLEKMELHLEYAAASVLEQKEDKSKMFESSQYVCVPAGYEPSSKEPSCLANDFKYKDTVEPKEGVKYDRWERKSGK